MTESPGSVRSNMPLHLVISLSEMPPAYKVDTKVHACTCWTYSYQILKSIMMFIWWPSRWLNIEWGWSLDKYFCAVITTLVVGHTYISLNHAGIWWLTKSCDGQIIKGYSCELKNGNHTVHIRDMVDWLQLNLCERSFSNKLHVRYKRTSTINNSSMGCNSCWWLSSCRLGCSCLQGNQWTVNSWQRRVVIFKTFPCT